MNKFWNVINSPLIVLLVALSCGPLILGISGIYTMKMGATKVVKEVKEGIFNPLSAVSAAQKEEKKIKEKYKESVTISNVGFGISDWDSKQKIIGTIKNGGTKAIDSIHLTVSYYDESGRLMDVDEQWMANLGSLGAGKEINFKLDHSLGPMGNGNEEIYKKNRASSAKVELAEFGFVE